MKLNYKRTILVGFAFFLISAFWQAYDATIPVILTNKFGMSQTWSGVIMALDNVLAVFLLPLFGTLSDKRSGKYGKRTPFITIGTLVAAVALLCLSFVDSAQLRNIQAVSAIDDKAALQTIYETQADSQLLTPEGERFVLGEGHRGYGVEAIYLTPETMKEIYDRLATYPEGVVEAFIKQHPEMCKLSPTSVNSLRFVTFSSNSKPVTADGKMMDIAYSIVRFGREGAIVDNLHSGGMVANVDLETGCLSTDGADRNGDLWVDHPDTGVTIKGFKVPYFEEAREMVKEAIATRKVEGYIGWDIAISENGPMLLEVNDRPGSDGLQTAPAQAKQGMKFLMEKYM